MGPCFICAKRHLYALDSPRFVVFSLGLCRWSLLHVILGQLTDWIRKVSNKRGSVNTQKFCTEIERFLFSPSQESLDFCILFLKIASATPKLKRRVWSLVWLVLGGLCYLSSYPDNWVPHIDQNCLLVDGSEKEKSKQ